MPRRRYVPDEGEVVWLDFNPHAGHEQAGHRPALVISPSLYNGKTGLLVCCPLSSKIKDYPFEVPAIVAGQQSVVLADRVKSLDWKMRRPRKMDVVPDIVLRAVRARIKALLKIR